MARKLLPADVDDKILDAVIAACAHNPLSRVTIATIAKLCEYDISESTILRHFGTKDDLFFATFSTIDKRMAARLSETFDARVVRDMKVGKNAEIEKAWNTAIDYFLENPEEALYYARFRNVELYVRVGQKPHALEDSALFQLFYQAIPTLHAFTNEELNAIWSAWQSATLSYMGKVRCGHIEDTPAHRAFEYRLSHYGLTGIVHARMDETD